MLVWFILVPVIVYGVGALITFQKISPDYEPQSASFAGIMMLLIFGMRVIGAVFWPIVLMAKVQKWWKERF